MSDNATTRHGQAAEPPIASFPFPGLPINLWSPAIAGCVEWNAAFHEGIATLSGEWQDFLSRRMKEDFALLQRVGASKSPEQVWSAYFAFWQKAAEDYSHEFARAANFTAGLMNWGTTGMHPRTEDATTQTQPLDKAA